VLINALRATDKGSITVSCTEDGDTWVLRIADTGGGMSADKVYYLTYGERTLAFEDDMESPFIKGNGVGYRIIRDLMGVMQASLAIESKLGEGTTVSLIFLK
jgi:signal transduction histidine kinase